MTTLSITIGDREQLREDTLQFVADAEEGIAGEGDERSILQSGTYDYLIANLTRCSWYSSRASPCSSSA